MNSDLNKLYPAKIKALNESPFHFEKRENAGRTLKAYNPICGDRFQLYINPKEQVIRELHFHGFGCAISKASTSMMVMTLEGKSFREALSLCNGFLRFLDGEKQDSDTPLPEDFNTFSGLRDYPERHDCVALSWKEMKAFLESKQG